MLNKHFNHFAFSAIIVLLTASTRIVNAAGNQGLISGATKTQDSSVKTTSGAPANANETKEGTLKEVMTEDEYKGFMAAQAYVEENSKYTLGATDVIEIQVVRHPEVSGQYAINSEGNIQYEFVGDVHLTGLTKQEVVHMITEKLSAYIINPEVNVKIAGYNSKIVYVIGEVGQPGKIFMRGDTISIREALLQAGLPLLSANTRKGSMFTPSNTGKVKKKVVDLHKLLYEGDLRENYVMNSGDTLYVPATMWAKAMRVISPVAQPVGAASGLGRTVATGGL